MKQWFVCGMLAFSFFVHTHQAFSETSSRNGLIGIYCYENGVLKGSMPSRTGLCASRYYVNGVLANNVTLNGVYYSFGSPANGSYGGKMYVSGRLATGLVGGKMYSNGVLLTGGMNGVVYSQGVPLTGFYAARFLKDGVMFTGVYKGIYYNRGVASTGVFENVYYRVGIPSTGKVDGLHYYRGPIADGVIEETCFVQGKVFSGVYASGAFQGVKCEDGLVVPEVVSLSASQGRTTSPLVLVGRAISSSSVKVLAYPGRNVVREITVNCQRTGASFSCDLSSLVNRTSAMSLTFAFQNKNGKTSLSSSEFKLLPPLPVISSVSPAQGPSTVPGRIQLSGSDLGSVRSVEFVLASGEKASCQLSAIPSPWDASVSCDTPAYVPAGRASIVVGTEYGDRVPTSVSYEFVAPPQILSISPTEGPREGGPVVIEGKNFRQGLVATFNGLPCGDGSLSGEGEASQYYVCDVPALQPGTPSLQVTNADGQSDSRMPIYRVLKNPSITSVDPKEGKKGDLVTVVGEYLSGAKMEVQVDGYVFVQTPDKLEFASDTMIKVRVGEFPPEILRAHDSPFDITVAMVSDTEGRSNEITFSYIPTAPTPKLLSLSPGEGSAGDLVFLTGENFEPGVKVLFDKGLIINERCTVESETAITCQLEATPPELSLPHTLKISVQAKDGSSSSGELDFLLKGDRMIALQSEPEDQEAVSGAASFKVVADGPEGMSYEWQRAVSQEAPFERVPDSTSDVLSLSDIKNHADGFLYRVVVSAPGAESVTSRAARLSVAPNLFRKMELGSNSSGMISEDGYLYFAEVSHLKKVTLEGKEIWRTKIEDKSCSLSYGPSQVAVSEVSGVAYFYCGGSENVHVVQLSSGQYLRGFFVSPREIKTFSSTWGAQGTQYRIPELDLKVNPKGEVVVLDRTRYTTDGWYYGLGSTNVKVYDPNGRLSLEIKQPDITALAVDSVGNYYLQKVGAESWMNGVFERRGGRLYVYNPEGQLKHFLEGVFGSIQDGLAIDGEDQIYAKTNSWPVEVKIFDTRGNSLKSWFTSDWIDFRRVSVSREKNVYYVSNNLQAYNSSGKPVLQVGSSFSKFGTPRWLSSLSVGPDGSLIVVDYEQVFVFNKEGKFLRTIGEKTGYNDWWGGSNEGTGELRYPRRAVATADGKLVVLDGSYTRLQQFDLKSGNFEKNIFLQTGSYAVDMALGPDGQLYLMFSYPFMVGKINLESGTYSHVFLSNSGVYPSPLGMRVDEQKQIIVLYIAEYGQRLVAVFSETGEKVREWTQAEANTLDRDAFNNLYLGVRIPNPENPDYYGSGSSYSLLGMDYQGTVLKTISEVGMPARKIEIISGIAADNKGSVYLVVNNDMVFKTEGLLPVTNGVASGQCYENGRVIASLPDSSGYCPGSGYYLQGVRTSLDASGSGSYNGKMYSNGSLLSGWSSDGQNYYVEGVETVVPIISSIQPTEARAGARVLVNGKNFEAGMTLIAKAGSLSLDTPADSGSCQRLSSTQLDCLVQTLPEGVTPPLELTLGAANPKGPRIMSTVTFKYLASEGLPGNNPNVFVNPEIVCGQAGNGCYDNQQAMAAGKARLVDGTDIELVPAAEKFKIWKDRKSERVLSATGLWASNEDWQALLDRKGTSFAEGDFTQYQMIAGRVCPPNVFLNHDNMTATGLCLYYDAGNEANIVKPNSSFFEAEDWLESWNRAGTGRGTAASFYEGNIKTCADKGMRLPTMYETQQGKQNSLPLGDKGVQPVWAGISNGVPAGEGAWGWTASAFPSSSGEFANYWKWEQRGGAGYGPYFNSPGYLAIRCVLPSNPAANLAQPPQPDTSSANEVRTLKARVSGTVFAEMSSNPGNGNYTGRFVSVKIGGEAIYAYGSSLDASRGVLEFELPSDISNIASAHLVIVRHPAAGFPGVSKFQIFGYSGNGSLEVADAYSNSNPVGEVPMWDDSSSTAQVEGTISIDISEFVRSFIKEGKTVAGFMIRGEKGQGYIDGYENQNEKTHPRLLLNLTK